MNPGVPIAMSVDQLMAKAREIAGVDIVDHDVVEPLTVLHRALCEESCLHEAGAAAMQKKLLRLLSNRLRMQRDFRRHPEIADEKIDAPLIAYGLARTGTTKTQKVLAATGDFNFFTYWQVYNPALFATRDESPAARIQEAEEHCRWFEQASPEARFVHPFEAQEPEEDSLLAEQSFRMLGAMGYSEVPSFVAWVVPLGPAAMFELLRDTMKYLQWQGLASANKKWLLKAPLYFGLEAELLKVFPDAHLLMTHRDPLQIVPSFCKLIQCFHEPYSHLFANPEMLCAGFAAQMDQQLALRKRSGLNILDLEFEETTRSMETVLAKIYAHAGMVLTPAARDRVRRWEAENPMHKKGANRYSLEQFGLNEEAVHRYFGRYEAFLKDRFPRR